MLQSNRVRRAPHFRTAVDGGRTQRARTGPSAPTCDPRSPPAGTDAAHEGLVVALCIAVGAGLWAALLWVLASALEVPTAF